MQKELIARSQIIKQVGFILDHQCTNCETRERYKKNTDPNIDKFCNNNCPVGIELQELGKQIIEDTRIHRIGG